MTTGLERALLAITELELKMGWLEQKLLEWPTAHAAALLNQLCESAERADPCAREALVPVVLLVASHGDWEPVARLREEATGRRLLALDRLLRVGPASPYRERPAGQLPIPDYGAGRELTLGERRSLARRPTRRAFDKLLADPHPMVIRLLLHNPKLTEADVVRLIARRPARVEAMREVSRTSHWLCRARVRHAILLNPGSPPEIAAPLLLLCPRTELLEIVHSTDTPGALRATALELLERRPPLREPAGRARMLQ